jgi:hypothetical protein
VREQLLLLQAPRRVERQRPRLARHLQVRPAACFFHERRQQVTANSSVVTANSNSANSSVFGITHSSANSSVFGITASRKACRFGCQQVCTPVSIHSRSVGKLNGSLERHRKQAVRLFSIL